MRVLLLGLDRDEVHVGPTHSLADRLGIIRIVLATLTVRDYKLRCHELHRMTELREFTTPIVCAAACLQGFDLCFRV
jgi:hypothetical protein